MIIHKCDRCGKKSEQEKGTISAIPDKWFELSYRASRYGHAHQTFELCPDCKAALKIPDELKTSDVGSQIIELIEEIVVERMEDGI